MTRHAEETGTHGPIKGKNKSLENDPKEMQSYELPDKEF